MSSISLELNTASPPTPPQGKYEVNSNVESPKSGTPGTYRQLQTNIRGESPSSTLSPSAKIISEMEGSGGGSLPESVDNLESPPADFVGVSVSNEREHGDFEKRTKHDKISDDEECVRENQIGGKFVKTDKKKRRINLSFPLFGAKVKKPHEVLENKIKQDESDQCRQNEDGIHVENKTMDGSQVEMRSDEMNCEQQSWNVNVSGCGTGTRANMAATGQIGQPELATSAGVAVSTCLTLPGDEGFNEHSQDTSDRNRGSGEAHIGGSGGIHTAAPPFLDEERTEELPITSGKENRSNPEMNSIEVKLAGMHSNIGFMEADIAEADFRNSMILEDLEDSVAEVDTTADKERVLAEFNDVDDGELDTELDIDIKADVNSTSALLDEIAQTISAIEEAHGGDYEAQDGTFEVQDGVYEVQGGVDGEIAYNVDTGEPEIDIPKFNLDMSDDEYPVINETAEEYIDEVDAINVKLDFDDVEGEMKREVNKTELKLDMNVDINSNAKLNQSDIDSSMNSKNEEIDLTTELRRSPFANGSGGEVEFNVDTGEPVLVSPSTSSDSPANGVGNIAEVNVENPSESHHVKFDLGKNEAAGNAQIPSTSTSIDQDHEDGKAGDKKKKGGFHFNFPWFGGKKPVSKQTNIAVETDVVVDTKHAADMSVGTEDLPGDTSDDDQRMVADVKAGGDTATLHLVTDTNISPEAPRKPPRDPSVDSEAEVSDYTMDIGNELPEGDADDFNLDINTELDYDASIQIEGPSKNVDDDGIKVSAFAVVIGAPHLESASKRRDAPEFDTDSLEIEAPELKSVPVDAKTTLDFKAPEIDSATSIEINSPEISTSLELKAPEPVSNSSEVKTPHLELNSVGVKSPKEKSASLKVKSPKMKPSSPKAKAHKVKSVPANADLDYRAKRKRKYFTLPNRRLKSPKPNREQTSSDVGVVNGGTGGSLQVKAVCPDVSAKAELNVLGVRGEGDGEARLDGDGGVAGAVNIKGPAQSNSLPRDSKLSPPPPLENDPSEQKQVTKKRSFYFPSINFSFPKFGGKRNPDVPAKDLNSKALSLETDVDVDMPSGGMDGAGDLDVHMVEEVQIQAQVKTAYVDISGRLKGLGGLHNGEHDFELENSGTMDMDDKVKVPSNDPNLPDICQSAGLDINLSINDQPSSQVASNLHLDKPDTGLEVGGNLNEDVQGDIEGEDIIKPVEGSVNFASRLSDIDMQTTQPGNLKFAELSFDDIDLTDDGGFKIEAEFNVDGDVQDLDIEDKVMLQEVHESDVCAHSSVQDVPSFSIEEKLAALAALDIGDADVPSPPLDVDVDINASKPDTKNTDLSAKVDVEVKLKESLPDVTLDVKGSPDLEAGCSHGGNIRLPEHPNGNAIVEGASPRARHELTLDVESPDVSIGTPSIDPSHSEASFELSMKGNCGSLKKEKKKMKTKKKKEKKDGKKKKGDRLNMSIDLEPGATSTPIKSRVQNGRHIPQTPDSAGNVSLDGAIAVHSNLSSPSYSESPRRPHSVVIAIDFGTTFSGYAYSSTRDPGNIQIMRKWEGGDPGVNNMKTPTTLLLTPEGEFHSFGFTARDYYHDMDHSEALTWLYFDKFKLVLHNDPDLCMTTEITAVNGRKLPAIKVFEHALRFFREHAIEELCDQSTDGTFDPDEIRWVLTVPAIWKQPAKQFMRQSAYLAGIASHAYPEQLLIALEPEAASICIRELRMKELLPEKISQRHRWIRTSMQKAGMDLKVSDSIRNGTRYMVVDCGGGTVDITVHEVEDQFGTLKELHKATGGVCGSVNIDKAFEALLVDIFGQPYIDEYKVKRPAGWVDLMIAFESRKRNANPWKNNPLNVSLPFSFIDYYKKYTNGLSTVEEEVARYDSQDVMWSAQGMLRFTPEGMQELFKPTISQIIQHVEDILNKEDVAGVTHIFLAGGFAQSSLLQHEMRKKFNSRLRVVIPCDVGLTILRGAVMFGLDPTAVRVRRSRLTYGVGVLNKFDPQKHPKQKYVMKDHREWCKDVFETFVKVDQSVAIGEQVIKCYTPARPNQKTLVINIYSSSNANVQFVTEEHVNRCGTLRIDVSESQALKERRKLHVSMQYGETEIKVSAVDESTGKCVQAAIDFLNK